MVSLLAKPSFGELQALFPCQLFMALSLICTMSSKTCMVEAIEGNLPSSSMFSKTMLRGSRGTSAHPEMRQYTGSSLFWKDISHDNAGALERVRGGSQDGLEGLLNSDGKGQTGDTRGQGMWGNNQVSSAQVSGNGLASYTGSKGVYVGGASRFILCTLLCG